MKTINIELTVLKAIGIIVVVSCHLQENLFNLVGIPISISDELFPEYSYHMPLFVFASGYFYKTLHEKNILELARRRSSSLKKYFKCNLFYFVTCFILINVGLLSRDIKFSLHSLFVEPFLGGFQFYFNGPGWFVPFLFLVQVIYTLIRKIVWSSLKNHNNKLEKESLNIKDLKDRNFKTTRNREIIFFITLIVIGIISVGISNSYPVVDEKVTVVHSILRVLFGLQFFQMGYIYKEYIAGKISYSFKTFISVILSKAMIFYIFGYYTFSLRTVEFNGTSILPFVVSTLGIIYCLHLTEFIIKICDKLKPRVIEFICFIGNNTWSIMMHHLFIKWILVEIYSLGFLPSTVVAVCKYVINPILCLLIPLGFSYVYDNYVSKMNIWKKLSFSYLYKEEKNKEEIS